MRESTVGADRQAGFTLAETLIAMAVLAMALAAVVQGFAGGWRGLAIAEEEAGALRVARSLLAAAGVETPLAEGVEDGRMADGHVWRVEIRRHGDEGTTAGPALELYAVRVEVRPPSRARRAAQPVRLFTVKLRAGR